MALDLSVPDMHFWHSSRWKYRRQEFIDTGNPSSLHAMLDAIAYMAKGQEEVTRGTWELADDWNEGIFSRQRKGRKRNGR